MFRNKWFWIGVIILASAAWPVTMGTAFHNLFAVAGSVASGIANAFHNTFHPH